MDRKDSPGTADWAAFIDGGLDREGCERLIERLDVDDEALDLFAVTLRNIVAVEASPDIDQGGRVAPSETTANRFNGEAVDHETRNNDDADSSAKTPEGTGLTRESSGPAVRRWVLVAAAVALAVGIGGGLSWWLVRSADPFAIQSLTADLSFASVPESSPNWSEHDWPVSRGPAALDDCGQDFRLGVLAADLHVALLTNDDDQATRLTYDIVDVLNGVELSEHLVVSYQEIRNGILGGRAKGELVELSVATEELAQELLEPSQFRFGKWSEVARVAANLGDAAHLSNAEFSNAVNYFQNDSTVVASAQLNLLANHLDEGVDHSQLDELGHILSEVVRLGGTCH